MKISGAGYKDLNVNHKTFYQQQTKNHKESINFKGANQGSTKFIDGILKNKLAKKLFNLASLNPHAFNLTAMAIMGIFLRPATILVFPGAKKEDKQYAAGKSVISSTITTVTQIALCIPLGKSIEKLAKAAEKQVGKTDFPKFKTKKFEAYNYLINNGFAVILSVVSSMIMAEAVTRIMNKILPNNKKTQKKPEIQKENGISAKVDGGAK